MPEPGANSNPGYLWLYRFLHSLAEFGRWCHVGFALDGQAARNELLTIADAATGYELGLRNV